MYPSQMYILHMRCFKTLAFLLAGLAVTVQAWAGTLDARLDRTRIAEGETVTLILSASGDIQGNPDVSPLNSDFEILGQSQGNRISIVNGRTSSTREWQLILMPRRKGELTIPELHVGALKSTPLKLRVQSVAATNTPGQHRPVMMEIEVEPKQPYVQSEVIYTVRVLSRVPLRNASLGEPLVADAIIERLGEDHSYQTQRQGETYQVIERRYAIFPQYSGDLKIESPQLSAAVPVQGGRRHSLRERFFGTDPFAGFPDIGDMFEETRPLRLRGDTVDLAVKPQPDGVTGPWLPAKNLTLAENWSPDPPEFRVGEPVTRTIALMTEGLSPAQLPDVVPEVPNGIKIYPDQPQSEMRPEGDDLIVTKTMKSALVPSVPGKFTLPEVKVQWWDTRTGKLQTARLPSRTIDVLPAVAGAAPTRPVVTTTPANSSRGEEESPATAESRETPSILPADTARSGATPWVWASGALGLAWLVTLGLWLRARARSTRVETSPQDIPPPRVSVPEHLRRIKSACLANDPAGARKALLDWAKSRWPEHTPRGLSALANRVNAEPARRVLHELDRVLYNNSTDENWDGHTAWSALEGSLRKDDANPANSSRSALPELYPRAG